MAAKQIRMIDGAEACPCGSGRPYRDCCLHTQVRYFRDATGKTIKFNLDCAPSSSGAPTRAPDESGDTGECDHDCEHCDKNGPVLLVLVTDGGIAVHVDMDSFSVYDMKHTLVHIAVTQAQLTRVLSHPQCREESDSELELPIMIVHEDEDGDMSFGSVDDYSPLSTRLALSAVAALESLRTEFLLTLFHIGLTRGSSSILGTEGDESEDDD